MATMNLASLSVDALLKLRDDIGGVLSRKANELNKQLAQLDNSANDQLSGRRGAHQLKGRKVAPKYRNPKNRTETWAGRGAMPRWLATAIKQGKKREAFAINQPAAAGKAAEKVAPQS
jgi:DNA-binding protein H-NS